MADQDYPLEGNASIEARVASEKTRLLYRKIPGVTLVNAVLAFILVLVAWDGTSKTILLGWVAVLGLVLLSRLLLLLAYRAAGPAGRGQCRWFRRFILVNALIGTCWGLIAVLLFPSDQLALQAMLTIALLILSAAAVMDYAVHWSASNAIVIPMTLPLGVRFLFEGQATELVLGLMVLLFAVVAVMSGHRLSRILHRSIALRMEAGQREALYASLFDASPLGIFHFDAEGTIREANQRFASLIGASRDRLIGLNLITDLQDRQLKTAVRESLDRGEGYYEGAYASATADKRTPVRVFLRGIPDEMDGIGGGVGLIEDFSARWATEQALKDREALLQRTSRAARIGGWELDPESGVVKWTATTRAIHGVTEDFQPTLENALDFYAGDKERERVRLAVDHSVQTGDPVDMEAEFIGADDQHRWVRIIAERETDDVGHHRLVGIIQDISDRKRMEQISAAREHDFRHVAENVPGMLYQLRQHADGRHLSMPYASGKIREIFGLEPEAVREDASALFTTLHPLDTDDVRVAMQKSADELSPFHKQFRVILQDEQGRERTEWIESISRPESHPEGGIIWHGFASLITERKRLEDEVLQRAYYDELTGLPNRVLVRDRLEHGIRVARRQGEQLAIMYLDLDGFKDINDAWGHGAGDRLLAEVAARLRGLLRDSDTLGRIGGDEFLLLIPERQHGEDAATLAGRLLRSLDAPFELDGQPVRVTTSIGISLFPDDADTAEDLLRHADAALYRAKAAGAGQWAWYEPHLTEEAMARRYLESELRAALESDALSVALQPFVRLVDGEVFGYEALARWQHDSEGWISPARFIPVAESRGLIARLAESIYSKAFKALAAKMQEAPGERPILAINVAPQQIQAPEFADNLQQLLREHGIDPGQIELEITEQLFMGDPEEPLRQLMKLRELGVKVSIDDFGTGFSSLSYLRQLPIDRLKIDMVFIRDVHRQRDNAAIVNTILALAREFGLQVTAEGIETTEEADHLRMVGCDSGQGYLFGRPELQ